MKKIQKVPTFDSRQPILLINWDINNPYRNIKLEYATFMFFEWTFSLI